MTALVRIAVVLVLVALAVPARATGPLANCSSGTPFLWAAGGAAIPFNPDQGDLGPLTHVQAVATVQAAFDTWGAVPSSTASYAAGAELAFDVDITNFGPFLDALAPDGLSAIVFDHTGEIFDLVFGPGSGVLGFAGPEWGDTTTCTITEGLSFLNGPSFDDLVAAQDVMVHEFGHYSNLAHTAVNGQIFLAGDESGPTPFNTFGDPADITVIETMYPFYFGPGSGTQTLESDDVSGISTLYPEASFAGTTGAISGTILASNGTTRLSGVNVIARNLADPFLDAVSAVSGDRTDAIDQTDALVGTYRLNGLTPGAHYAVYVDEILAGGFGASTILLPQAEEFSNGAAESDNVTSPDDPSVFAAFTATAGAVTGGANVIFNAFRPGDPLPVGDDGSVELPLPFPVTLCGQSFGSVFVNANGSLTFGAPSSDFSETTNELLSGPPRIAGLWDDLDPSSGGVVTFQQSSSRFTASWTDVPEFAAPNGNTFAISIRPDSATTVTWGIVDAVDGIAGVSCGGAVTSGFENETRLRRPGTQRFVVPGEDPALFEAFTEGDNALDGYEIKFLDLGRSHQDAFPNNDDVAHAARISLPFASLGRQFTEISPSGGDVDYFKFRARAGDILALEVVRGGFDSVLGVFDANTGDLLAVDDDGGGGLLSRLLLQANVDIDLAVAVSAFPDFDFTGAGVGSGRYVIQARSYRGTLLPAGDDTSTPVALQFPFTFGGTTWNEVFVNSNGNLTFGAGDGDFSESVAELLAGPPRIAPLWDDLDASDGLVIEESNSLFTRVHYVSVPEFFSDAGNYFSAGLARGGASQTDWAATTRSDALVGRSVGGGAADPGETNLSDRALPLFGGPTVYEQFLAPDPFDLNYRQAIYTPAP